ncbi:MAG: hypothetical protein ACKODX_06185 [Gemmata sp.]
MPKPTKKPAPAKKPTPTKKARPASAKRTNKEDAQGGPDAEHEAYYQANKERIDKALKYCVKHFDGQEPDIVRAVGRMLFAYYMTHRMSTPKGGANGIM